MSDRLTLTLEILAGDAGGIVELAQRPLLPFEDDAIVFVAFFQDRRLIAQRGGKVLLPHLERRLDVRIGIDQRTKLPAVSGGRAFGHGNVVHGYLSRFRG